MLASRAEFASVLLLAAAVFVQFGRLARLTRVVLLLALKLFISFTVALTLYAAFKLSRSAGAVSTVIRALSSIVAAHRDEL
jgi:hypothetical protein